LRRPFACSGGDPAEQGAQAAVDGFVHAFWKLAAAGFTATAVTYGPARMGFGLFVPEFRSTFSLSTGTAGLVSGLGFLGFLLGLLAAVALTARFGPRLPIMLGLAAAALGMGTIALAPNLPLLSIGVVLAMSSSGFSWTPFNNAVHRLVPEQRRAAALSVVSTGTALGVVAAGASALGLALGDQPWRIAWAAFAAASALAALTNWVALRDVAGTPGRASSLRWTDLLTGSARPLYGIALSFGTTSTIFITFAADRVEHAGGLPGLPEGTSPSVVFVAYGLFGLAGLATGRAKAAAGLPGLLRLLFLASTLSLLLVALSPTSWAGVVASAGLQGVCVMMTSAVLAFWSERLFPDLPAISFTAALLASAAGGVIGPVAAGYVADAFGSGAMFCGAAAISAATAAAVRSRHIRER